jgi:predicted outer membrane repeat protein
MKNIIPSLTAALFASLMLLAASALAADPVYLEPGASIAASQFKDGDTIILKGDVSIGTSFDLSGTNYKTLIFQSDTVGVTRIIDGGGARNFLANIADSGTITFNDIEFRNTIRNGVGGFMLINPSGGTGTTSILGNFTVTSATNNNNGGAIQVSVGSLYLGGNVTFTGNVSGASHTGGAINIATAGATLTFAGVSTFNSNTAGTNGGGAINIGTGALVFKDNATFTNNTAPSSGAAIRSGGSILFEKDAFFYSNTMSGNTTNIGGAIQIGAASSLSILGNATFENNHNASSSRGGGAIYSIAAANSSSISISGSTLLSGNSAAQSGGAIYVLNAGNSLTFSGYVTATGNTAGSSGGVVSMANNASSGNLVLGAGGIFSHNTATGLGGAIHHNATSGGGVIDVSGHAIFSSNTAGTHGGAIWSAASINFHDGVEMRDNIATNNGGAIVLNTVGAVLDVSGYAILSSNTGVGGGAIWANGDISFHDGVEMRDNTATGAGGAIRINTATNAIAITGPFAITGNFANNGGGAIFTPGTTTSFVGTGSFTGNASNSLGGALYFEATAAGTDYAVTFSATGGDITFSGNLQNNSTTAEANAIYIKNDANATASFALTLDDAAGDTINFLDPIASATTGANLVAVNVTKTGAGTVLFGTHQSAIVATTTVAAGAFKLTGGAIYGAGDTPGSGTGSFTVAAGATLAANGTIRAAAIIIASGATLEALEGGSLVLDPATASDLTLGAGLTLAGSGTIDLAEPLSAATVRPGETAATAVTAAQTLAVTTATLTLEDGAILRHDLFAANAASRLDALGDLVLAGTATIDLDADHQFDDLWGGDGALVAGVLFDTLNADSRPVAGTDLDNRQRSLGVYGTLTHGAWFADALIRYSTTSYTVDARGDRLRVKGNGHAFTLEASRVFQLRGAGCVEPSISLIFQRQTFEDSGDRFVRDYRFGSISSLQLLAGVRWSTLIPVDSNTRS